jgi:hypothetical protein
MSSTGPRRRRRGLGALAGTLSQRGREETGRIRSGSPEAVLELRRVSMSGGMATSLWREPVRDRRGSQQVIWAHWRRMRASARRAHGGCLGVGGRGRTRPRGEMPRGGAGSQRSGDVRMGQPARRTAGHLRRLRRAPGELKHLSTPRNREDSLSSGERTGRSPNPAGAIACRRCQWGVERVGWRGRQPPRRTRIREPKTAGTGHRRG